MSRALAVARLGIVVARIIFCAPLWAIFYLIPSNRQRPSWSIGQSLFVRAFYELGAFGLRRGHLAALVPAPPQGLSEVLHHKNVGQPTARKDGLVAVPPAPLERIGSELVDIASRNGVAVNKPALGYWFGERSDDGKAGYKATANERVILHIHGGGFLFDTGGPDSISTNWVHRIRAKSSVVDRAFMLDYRLASVVTPTQAPRNPFPAALIDCLSAYFYLIGLGFSPENIIVTGDSAGGNLALTLTRHLSTIGVALPGHLVVLSPAADLTLSHNGPESSGVRNTTDFSHPWFAPDIMLDAIRGLALSREDAIASMWLNPGGSVVRGAAGWFSGFKATKTIILAGGAEASFDGMWVLRDRMWADLGEKEKERCVWLEGKDMPHNWPNSPIFDPQGEDAIKRVVKFIEN